MKKDKRTQSNSKQNTVKNCNNNKVSNSAKNNRTSDKKEIGFDDEDKSFNLDENEDHSFELR